MTPDPTAQRTALWRALHLLQDDPPYLVEDTLALALVDPEPDWQQRPDMRFTARLRASVVARSRFVEELIRQAPAQGIHQVIHLGAGLDTFAERHPQLNGQLQLFEVDRRETLAWKRERLNSMKVPIPPYHHWVSADLSQPDWWYQLSACGWNPEGRSLLVSAGLSLYLAVSELKTLMRHCALLAPGSRIAMAFYLPKDLLDPEDQPMQDLAEAGARASGTPFQSFFRPEELRDMALQAGLQVQQLLSTQEMFLDYGAGRSDGWHPASGEVFLLATIGSSSHT